jgi:hypothetical protein
MLEQARLIPELKPIILESEGRHVPSPAARGEGCHLAWTDPSVQPWRAFHRGCFLLTTNVRPLRRTTTEPAFCFKDLSELLTFIISSFLLSRLTLRGRTLFPSADLPLLERGQKLAAGLFATPARASADLAMLVIHARWRRLRAIDLARDWQPQPPFGS